MCGIHCVFGKKLNKDTIIKQSKKIKHRGGDESDYFKNENCVMCHERLSIIGVDDGKQPIYSKDENIVLVVNGEIYNYKELYDLYFKNVEKMTKSDCEIIIHLYEKFGKDFMKRNDLSGMFSFVLYDLYKNIVIVSRDPIGIIPLYFGYDKKSNLYVTSEFKTFSEKSTLIKQYNPGCYSILNMNEDLYILDFKKYYKPKWKIDDNYFPTNDFDEKTFLNLLTDSVRSHMNSDVPYGVLLSGGLDSSLITSIANRIHKEKNDTKLKTFCIGLEGSPDIEAAEEISRFLDTEHYSFIYTLEEGLKNIENTIYFTETYDTTTIRSSTPMILMAKKINEMGIKMILTGEGSDELWGSYAYFQYSPNEKEFYKETVRKVLDLHNYDLLRCNKSMMSYSIESRVPYLDNKVIDYIMNLHPKYKMWGDDKIEKYFMRKTFQGYLPEKLLWRKKEQFSDGVGYNWIDEIQKYSKKIMDSIPDYKFNKIVIQPDTPEEKYYRFLFEKYYGSNSCLKTFKFTKSVACSTGVALKWLKNINVKDPSGRSVNQNDIFKIK